jgi:hypothetical protein
VRREIYLFCDQHRSFERIAAFAAERGASGEAVREFLGEMVEAQVMVTADGHFLSLGIRVELEPRTVAPARDAEACALRN